MGQLLRRMADSAAREGETFRPAKRSIQRIEQDVADFGDRGLARLHDHWNCVRGDRPWLNWQDFRPEACGAVLARLALIEASSDAAPGHRIRLTGEAIANPRLGFAKGRLVEAIRPSWYRDHLVDCYSEAFTDGCAHRQLVLASFRGSATAYERLILPATRTGEGVDLILVATSCRCHPNDLLRLARARLTDNYHCMSRRIS